MASLLPALAVAGLKKIPDGGSDERLQRLECCVTALKNYDRD